MRAFVNKRAQTHHTHILHNVSELCKFPPLVRPLPLYHPHSFVHCHFLVNPVTTRKPFIYLWNTFRDSILPTYIKARALFPPLFACPFRLIFSTLALFSLVCRLLPPFVLFATPGQTRRSTNVPIATHVPPEVRIPFTSRKLCARNNKMY